MMEFLYFPQDKTEYIPALISLAVFVLLAVITFYLIQRHSKKEAEKMDAKYAALSSSDNNKDHLFHQKPPQ